MVEEVEAGDDGVTIKTAYFTDADLIQAQEEYYDEYSQEIRRYKRGLKKKKKK